MIKILFVGHNTSYSGAPKSLLRIMTYLRKNGLAEFDCLLRNGGPMTPEYQKVSKVYEFLPESLIPVGSQPFRNLLRAVRLRWHRRNLLRTFRERKYDVIYSNTVVNANVLEFLSVLHLPVIAHLREMHTAIEAYGGGKMIDLLDRFVTRYISVSQTAKSVLQEYGVAADKIEVIYNFLEKAEIDDAWGADPQQIRRDMGIPDDAVVIGNVGTFNLRKGADLFMETAALILNEHRDAHFIWVGAFNEKELEDLLVGLGPGQRTHIHMPGEIPHPYAYYKVLDILLLTSRDDPFPLTAMEAAYFKKPVVCIAGTGGIPEVLNDSTLVVPEAQAEAIRQTLTPLMQDVPARTALGQQCHDLFIRDLSIENQMEKIIKLIFDVSGQALSRPVQVPKAGAHTY